MTDSERQELQTAIHQEMATLEEDIQQLSGEVKPIPPDRAIGRLTRMEAINSKSMCEANLRKAKNRLGRLRQALSRLDDEDYGICQSCERPIPIKRLLLVPESTRCVACLSR